MNDRLTEIETGECISKLCHAYGRPFGTKAKALVDLWHGKLRQFPAAAVQHAVDDWIDREPKWPPIVAIIAGARALAPKASAPPLRPYICTACKTVPEARVWYIERRTRADDRPGRIVVPVAGRGDLEFVWTSRDLCRCQWRATLARLTETERRLTEERLAPPPHQEAP